MHSGLKENESIIHLVLTMGNQLSYIFCKHDLISSCEVNSSILSAQTGKLRHRATDHLGSGISSKQILVLTLVKRPRHTLKFKTKSYYMSLFNKRSKSRRMYTKLAMMFILGGGSGAKGDFLLYIYLLFFFTMRMYYFYN